MTRKITKEALEKIKAWEGLRLEAYLDVVGVLTIGYGHTGEDVTPNMKISKKKAEELLLKDLSKFEEAVESSVKVDLNDNQFGALVSFAFNVGVSAFLSSTLLKLLNSGNYAAVPVQLMRWNKGTDRKTGKKVEIPGLTHRRLAEIGLWNSGAFVASQYVEPVAPEPKRMDTSTKVGTITAGAGGAAATITETATQLNLISDSPYIKGVCALLILAGLGVTIYGIMKSNREA